MLGPCSASLAFDPTQDGKAETKEGKTDGKGEGKDGKGEGKGKGKGKGKGGGRVIMRGALVAPVALVVRLFAREMGWDGGHGLE